MGKTQSSDWKQSPEPPNIKPGQPFIIDVNTYYNVTDNPGPLNTRIVISNDGSAVLTFTYSILNGGVVIASYQVDYYYGQIQDFEGIFRYIITGYAGPKNLIGSEKFSVIKANNETIIRSFNVELGGSSDLYKKGDIYNFVIYNLGFPQDIKVNFLRDGRGGSTFNSTNALLTNKIHADTNIKIISQTLIDGSDIGNTIFTVGTKIYEFCAIKIVNVLIDAPGVAVTAADKVSNIFNNQPTNTTLEQFGNNIMFYSLLRFILAKLLFGNFNIKYLLNKYTKRFLYDLQHSEYKSYLHYFTDPNSSIFGYEQYFK